MDPNRVELPSGGWVELREVNEITERYRRPIARALAQLSPEGMAAMENLAKITDDGKKKVLGMTVADLEALNVRFPPLDLDLLSTANDHCVVALVKAWSFPVAITVDSVLDLAGRDYDKLRELTAPAAGSLFVDFTMTKENVTNPDSPFGPSNGSATTSTDSPAKTPDSPILSGAPIDS